MIGNTVVGRVAVTTLVESNTDDIKLWLMRLGHIGERGMLELHKRNLLKRVKTCKLDFCKYCVYGKQHRVSFKTGSHTSKGVLDYIHLDVWGPISVSFHKQTLIMKQYTCPRVETPLEVMRKRKFFLLISMK